MTARNPHIPIDQMRLAPVRALSYVDGQDKDQFLADTRTQEAVVLNLLVIGETASRLAREHAEWLEQYPSIPWRDMRGMRNRIAHGYFDLDMRVVWETMQTAPPDLLERLSSAEFSTSPSADQKPKSDL